MSSRFRSVIFCHVSQSTHLDPARQHRGARGVHGMAKPVADRFRLEKKLGSGAFGNVYLGELALALFKSRSHLGLHNPLDVSCGKGGARRPCRGTLAWCVWMTSDQCGCERRGAAARIERVFGNADASPLLQAQTSPTGRRLPSKLSLFEQSAPHPPSPLNPVAAACALRAVSAR